MCHVGVISDGWPRVIPMVYGVDGDRLYLHGSGAAGIIRDLQRGSPVCVTVTLLDGLVMADSARNHSVNYRSVTAYGIPEPITDPAAKLAAFRVITEHIAPDRWDHLRPLTDAELRETAIWQLALDHASAKVRTGPPLHSSGHPVWTGVIPLSLTAEEPIPAPAAATE